MSGKTRRLNGKSWVIVIKVLKSILAVFMLLSIVGRAMTSRRHDAYGNENWEFNDDDAIEASVHQRPSHQRSEPQVLLAAWAPSGRPSGIERLGFLTNWAMCVGFRRSKLPHHSNFAALERDPC
ncbi:MAG: hypothetical protein ACLPH5_08005 [Candidatus Sulfotelmatobacter sp.]